MPFGKVRKDVALDASKDSTAHPADPCQRNKQKMKKFDKIKLLDFIKHKKSSKRAAPLSSETPAVNLDFNGNLEQNLLAEAQQQLVAAEEHLFGSTEATIAEEEEDKLQRDYEIFILHLRMVIYESFDEGNQEKLKSAVTAILQEEAQDRRWENLEVMERPAWRPTKCREIHNSLLQIVVEERMKNSDEQENGADKLSTSLKREVCRMGRQVQKDLLRVVRRLRECYPPDFDVCRTYAELYHQAFSTRLQELTKSSIDFEDCHYILSWIVNYYPSDVLNHRELEEHMHSSSLGPLLSEEDLKTLQEQYFSHKEKELKQWLANALEKEVEKWHDGTEPELMDGYFFSNLAVDVIPLIDATVREIRSVVACESQSQNVLCQLDSFLISYMKNLEEFIKTKQESVSKTLSASLVNIHQFRDYIQKAETIFPEESRAAQLSTLANAKTVCHRYFLSRFHTELKSVYSKLWTQAWLTEHDEIVEELVKTLEHNTDHFKELKAACREELMGELHTEVLCEYVRRMMKRKLKLKEKEQQEKTAEFMCQDSRNICAVFANAGSKEDWLSEILPKLSEILRLQDIGTLELEIVTLTRVYPDLSEQHVLAVLNLKTNLLSSDVLRIRHCLSENRYTTDATESLPAFFSKVNVKKKIL